MTMQRRTLDYVCAACRSQQRLLLASRARRRDIHISATPTSTEPSYNLSTPSSSPVDARFEVLGAPFSLLSASISASQNLYTRKGSLVGFNGSPENAISTLSLLSPFRRLPLFVPFIYQRVTSTTPYTALIAPSSRSTSLTTIHLDGRTDWAIASRSALLAWTGHNLTLTPSLSARMPLAYNTRTLVSGRGLLALAARGVIQQVHLKAGEEYIVHPSHILAYTIVPSAPPAPYRFRSHAFKLQIPNPFTLLPDTRFLRTMRESTVWRFLSGAAYTIRTWMRRTVWGDRLFLHFQGPTTILLQSRGTAIRDVLTREEVDAIADTPAGSVQKAVGVREAAEAGVALQQPEATSSPGGAPGAPVKMGYASVGQGGQVKFEKQA